MRKITVTALLGVVVGLSRTARADCTKDSDCKGDRVCESGKCVAPAPVALVPPPPAPTPAPVGAPPASSQLAPPLPPRDAMVVDAVRVRGGISGGAGVMLVAASSFEAQPVVHVTGRLGVQFNHLFSLYYQNTAAIVIVTEGSGVLVSDYNAILANLTFAHHVDLGVGPSVDYSTLTASDGTSLSAVTFGPHVRLAGNIGPLTASPRRRGVSVGLDIHPTIGGGGVLTLIGVGCRSYFAA